MTKKPQPDLVIDKLGTHLFRVTRKDGTQKLSWAWDVLLKEVQEATSQARYIELNDKLDAADKEASKLVKLVDEVIDGVRKMEEITQQNIIKITEAKVAKTRKPRAKKVKNETNS